MRPKLILALPSKGRLMEQSSDTPAQAGLAVSKSGSPRLQGRDRRLARCRGQFHLLLRRNRTHKSYSWNVSRCYC